LRRYGLTPIVGAPLCAPPPVRHLVEVPSYATWDEVVARPDEFIRTLYTQERIEAILATPGKSGSKEPLGT
jgi:hypothetical protein